MTLHSTTFCVAGACLTFLGLGTCALARAYSTNDIIATYAGNATQGYSGDGGPAVSAQLNEPSMMALDAAGNLYISDYGSNTIRKVSTTGIITTIAGTGTAGYNGDGIAATTAQLNNPRGIAFDAAGNLYVADAGNQRIRVIAAATGIISTAAGTGAQGCNNDVPSQATFNAPLGLAFDAAGTLYISEIGNRIVRKLSGGFVSSFAGTCTQTAFQLPWGLTTDSSGYVYVADDIANRVFKLDSGGNQTLFAGNGAGGNTGDGSLANAAGVTLTNPMSIVIDSAGNTYIGSSNVVRVVTADGIIHTSAGSSSVGNSGDGGLATSAALNGVAGLAVNAAGRLLIADLLSAVVRIVGPAAPVTVAVAGDGIAATGDGIASADGRINCPGTCGANYVNGMPVIFDATPASPDPLYQWTGVPCSGNAACTLTPHTALPTSIAGRFTPWYIKTLLGGTVGPALLGPFALTFDAQGNLYFTEATDCVVRKRSTNGTLTTVAGNGVCGDLGDGIPANQAELNNPQGVVLDAAGNIYIQDTGNAVIRKVAADGVLHTFASGVYTGSNSPALAINSEGDLFMLGSANTVVRVTADGMTHPFATIPYPMFGLANGIQGGIVVYGMFPLFNATFTYVSAQGVAGFHFSSPVGAGTFPPSGLVLDHRGVQYNEFRFCEIFTTPVMDLSSGYYVTSRGCSYGGDGGPAIFAHLNGAVGLAFDSYGYLYVADYGNNAIRKLYPDAIFTGNWNSESPVQLR